MRAFFRTATVLTLLCIVFATQSHARVADIIIHKRSLLPESVPTGDHGRYEKVEGIVTYVLDPSNPQNASIVDLDRARRNAQGLVSFKGNFVVYQPVDPKKRRGIAWMEVSNRGGKAGFRYFQNGLRGERADVYGDGLLFRQGVSMVWVGWQFDVPREGGRLWVNAPVAKAADGKAITGLVRADWVVDERVETLGLAHRTMRPLYRAIDFNDRAHKLTRRQGRNAPREALSRASWRFNASGTAITGDFEAGYIYELVYKSRHPRVVGVGLAAIRDFASYIKYQPDNPFKVDKAVAFGVSQTGRFLRHYLYQGFNTDEAERKVLDGAFIHTAGAGRGSFNHRFAQPSRDGHRYSAFFYPTDIFPFSSQPQSGPDGGREGWLDAQRSDHIPKIFATNTGYEYWGRAAALIHSDWKGEADLTLHPKERLYHIAGGQHFVGRTPQDLNGGENSNPLNFFPLLRALAIRMIDWVADDIAPPESTYPTIENGTLVPHTDVTYPEWLGIANAPIPQTAYFADYGRRWLQGIIDTQPPKLGAEIIPLVPQVDENGNEIGGVRLPQVEHPVVAYLPWSQRGGLFNPGEMNDFRGRIVALPHTNVAILNDTKEAAQHLVNTGLLLAEDVSEIIDQQKQLLELKSQL